ncbi:hypothetical protein KAJ87_00720 [Candidatus Pacearchaeota archaeon]|nr:hypothetical protein [Candidatus Pacearchaeota archaeon]
MAIQDLLTNIDFNQLILKGVISVALIVLGICLGKILTFGLKKLSQKLDLNKKIRGSFIDLFLVVIRWSIYLIFISLGLNQLEIPFLTNFFTSILITIPAFVGALILLTVGFAIAVYLREVVEDAEITGWDLISKIIFFFVLYVSGVYALKTALISFHENTTNMLIIVLTIVISTAIAFVIAKKSLKNPQ